MPQRKLEELLDSLYGSILEDSQWQVFLQKFCELSHASQCGLLFNDRTNASYSIDVNVGFHPDAPQLYARRYGEIDEYVAGGRGKLHTGWVGLSQQLVSDESLLKSEFYNDYQRKFEMFHQCGAVLELNPNRFSAITCLRSRRAGPFGATHIRLLRDLLPHLQRALKAHEVLRKARLKRNRLEGALERMQSGVMLLDRSGKIVFANCAAISLVNSNESGLFCREDELFATDRRANDDFQAAIRGILLGISSSSDFQVPRPDGSIVYVGCTRLHSQVYPKIGVMVMLSHPEGQRQRRIATMKQVYKLSPAEIALAMELTSGSSLVESSRKLGVTLNTAKTQLASIFFKTQTSRQSQVVLLLSSLPTFFHES